MEVERHLGRREKKEKISVSLSGELLMAMDAVAGSTGRSAFVERAIRAYLKRMVRRHHNERDLALINAHAHAINRESDGLLEFQSWPE